MIIKFIILIIGMLNFAQAQISINPISLNLKPNHKMVKLEITNTSERKQHFQVSVNNWAESEAKDLLEPVQSWIISPSIVSIEPGKKQLIRLAPKQKTITNNEQAFRVLLDEIPQHSANEIGIKIKLKISLPLFIESAEKTDLPIKVQLTKTGLSVFNPNNHHLNLGTISQGANKTPVSGCVLPGKKRLFPLASISSGKGLKLEYSYLEKTHSIDVLN